eukprot:3547288-Prymnesium_polylepis.1
MARGARAGSLPPRSRIRDAGAHARPHHDGRGGVREEGGGEQEHRSGRAAGAALACYDWGTAGRHPPPVAAAGRRARRA